MFRYGLRNQAAHKSEGFNNWAALHSASNRAVGPNTICLAVWDRLHSLTKKWTSWKSPQALRSIPELPTSCPYVPNKQLTWQTEVAERNNRWRSPRPGILDPKNHQNKSLINQRSHARAHKTLIALTLKNQLQTITLIIQKPSIRSSTCMRRLSAVR